MELDDLIRRALEAVHKAEVPVELRAVAFEKAFDYLTAGPQRDANKPPRSTGGSGDRVGRLAERVGVPRELVERVFFIDGDRVELVVPSNRLHAAKAAGTEQIALLIAAARQGTGLDDEWTGVDPIREVCENFKRHDPSNFATTIKDMGDVFTVRGVGRDRKVRMTAPAWQRARELVMSVAGG